MYNCLLLLDSQISYIEVIDLQIARHLWDCYHVHFKFYSSTPGALSLTQVISCL
jgi:hypothetical protein